jgi:hypothetical protein
MWVSYKKKILKVIFTSLKSLKKGVGFRDGSRSGSISQSYGSRDPDPDPHQNVTDPQQWKKQVNVFICVIN